MKMIISLHIIIISTCFAQSNIFKQALIKFDPTDGTPVEIKFNTGKERIALDAFLHAYREKFLRSQDITFKTLSTCQDELEQVHHRISQSYRGIDLPMVQMLVHEKDGSVVHAHGKFIHHLNIDIIPSRSEEQALRSALKYVNASAYMWENHKNESFIKQLTGDPQASFYPKGKLIITAGHQAMKSQNMRLAYRFTINSSDPYGGYDVDVDANTREIIDVIPFIYSGDFPGEGSTIYNNLVDITVSDTISEFPASPKWHLDRWMALSDGGFSWWMADTSIAAQGGYGNKWYEVLDTDTLTLSAADCRLTYYQRYFVEPYLLTNGEFHGFDGCNVRLSADGGATWKVLSDPEPQYSCASLAGFGETHGEGPGIPGWAGPNTQWHEVSFDLSAYSGKTIKIRFAFASDYSYATSEGISGLFGWQIDDVLIFNAGDTLFRNSGEAQGMTAGNIAKDVPIIIGGNYRLREKGRGNGIATYDLQNQPEYYLARDFVDEDSSFIDPYSRAGVSVHWASEVFYDYFHTVYNRLSYDDRNGRIISFAHHGDGIVNAFWNANLHIAGYGDGKLNSSPLVSLDIVGHELTHGVTQFTSRLLYRNEAGALNESFSDIFGAMIEFYIEGDQGNWLIGEDFSADGGALRSLENPASHGHPETYKGNNWFPEPSSPAEKNDWGGVHTNCSVQNYWFYLLSEGGSGINDKGFVYDVTGIGKEAAAQIAYRNLTVYLMPASKFMDARWGSINAALDIFGLNSPELQAVAAAWDAVGVDYPRLTTAIGSSVDTLKFATQEAAVGVDTTALVIYNYGLDTLLIAALQISGTEFALSSNIDFPIRIDTYQQNTAIDLIFAPASDGVKTDSITFYSNDPRHPAYTVYLRGKGWLFHPARVNTMYALTDYMDSQPGLLIKFDGTTDQWQSIDGEYKVWISDLGLNPLSGKLFGIDYSNKMFRIDPESGNMSHLITLADDGGGHIDAITFDVNGDLYGLDSRYLYFINLVTGETLLKGELDSPFSCSGLAINPLNDELWASGRIFGREPALFKINKSNGRATYLGETALLFSAIAFDDRGRLYGLEQDHGVDLYQIDTLDLSGTRIGPTGHLGINGLVIRGEIITDMAADPPRSLPLEFGLQQNYPNPFNPSTAIEFQIPKSEFVTIKIFNILGEEVVLLVNENLRAGVHTYSFNGRHLASGIYLYRIEAGEFVDIKKMVLIR